MLSVLPPGRAMAQVPSNSQTVPAPSQTTGGGATGQSGTNPSAPAGVPEASQKPASQAEQGTRVVASSTAGQPVAPTIWEMKGLRVDSLQFQGVTFDGKESLPNELPQKAGQPLDPMAVRDSTRRLFASGRYRDIAVRAVRTGDGVALFFAGTPQYFVGRITINGVKIERLSALLEYATRLDPGTAFTQAEVPLAVAGIRDTLQRNGYYQATVSATTELDVPNQQENVNFAVLIGPQARVGDIRIDGNDPGLTEKEFRKKGKLKRRSKVTRDTTSNALDALRGVYQKKDRLEGTVTLEKQTYDPNSKLLNYAFRANQGPAVKVSIEGVKVSKSRLKLLIPVFEEGTIDNDLLNEGRHNISDFMQQQGYFDAKVDYRVIGEGTPSESVVYTVDKGERHKVLAVNITGNKYFNEDTLRERVRVQRADLYVRNGRYSQALVTADVSSIQSIYRANGFSSVKVNSAVRDIDTGKNGKQLKVGGVEVTYTVDEGPQQSFGTVTLAGVDSTRMPTVRGLMNAQEGQPFSLITLSGDRDAVLGYFISNGFDQATVEVRQVKEKADPTRTDVMLEVTEGQAVAIDKVLLSGDKRTRPGVVNGQVTVHAGDPLDQSALLDTQRNLYNLALFNEVVAAVQNPQGKAPEKNVLIQLTEARRWDVTYGFGFEAQTGTPSRGQISPASAILLGLDPNDTAQYSQNGKAGVSPRVSLDVSRINLRGTDQSLTLHTTYGLLETVAQLSYNTPHLFANPNFAATISGGYSNVQNITTFTASTLQADFRVTEKYKRKDTFIYDFQYRRVKVDPGSLQVSANLIPLLSQPVRVGGPGVTWFHDTRSPSPLDAHKGSYTSVQEFLSSSKFGSQTSFNRVDASNATYYEFGKHKYVFARNTRFGFENVFGANPNVGNPVCVGVLLNTNPSCSAVPLPERLYAGGATSLRGFSINSAGPRDLQTGYPVGGTAVFINQLELRLPPPTLPIVGSSVNFVVFHDMGNVFQNAGDLFPSVTRFHQPDRSTCTDVSSAAVQASHVGTCNFNYFSHAVGLGARYNTPVGPVRADFSLNLNPTIYPVLYDFSNSNPHVGTSGRFNFFFSIGQSF